MKNAAQKAAPLADTTLVHYLMEFQEQCFHAIALSNGALKAQASRGFLRWGDRVKLYSRFFRIASERILVTIGDHELVPQCPQTPTAGRFVDSTQDEQISPTSAS